MNLKRILIYLSFITLVTIITYSCERDDICAETTQTTPRLIIEFYDAADTDELKNVPRLTVYGEGLVTDPTEASDTTLVFNNNINLVELPLRIGTEDETITTRYVLEKETNFRLDTDDTTESNIDIIEITYSTEFVFVSRACGYKSIFNNISVTRVTDSEPWIGNIEIETTLESTIENENTTHVRIFH